MSGAVILSTLSAQTFTTLYNFGSYAYDGTRPTARVILGPQGELYGTTSSGGYGGSDCRGPNTCGTIYQLLPPPASVGAWTEAVLHSFNGHDGSDPGAALLMGPSGALYGMTQTSQPGGDGYAFELDPPTGGSTHWSYAVVYQFPHYPYFPAGPLAFGVGQSLYGNIGKAGGGAVYSLTGPPAAGGAWTQTMLYSFPGGSAGTYPVGMLAVSSNGTLFGVTYYGGKINKTCPTGCGTVFSLTPPETADGPWTQKILYAFDPQIGDGTYPAAGLVIGPNGVLYGTTVGGGGRCKCGTVFSLTPPAVPGAPMTETVLHVFTGSTDGDGWGPQAALVLAPNGVLYGATQLGGAFGGAPGASDGWGTVFELAPPASPEGSWTETILHSFAGAADGFRPNALTLGKDGTLYGTTGGGGPLGEGTVFALTP